MVAGLLICLVIPISSLLVAILVSASRNHRVGMRGKSHSSEKKTDFLLLTLLSFGAIVGVSSIHEGGFFILGGFLLVMYLVSNIAFVVNTITKNKQVAVASDEIQKVLDWLKVKKFSKIEHSKRHKRVRAVKRIDGNEYVFYCLQSQLRVNDIEHSRFDVSVTRYEIEPKRNYDGITLDRLSSTVFDGDEYALESWKWMMERGDVLSEFQPLLDYLKDENKELKGENHMIASGNDNEDLVWSDGVSIEKVMLLKKDIVQ